MKLKHWTSNLSISAFYDYFDTIPELRHHNSAGQTDTNDSYFNFVIFILFYFIWFNCTVPLQVWNSRDCISSHADYGRYSLCCIGWLGYLTLTRCCLAPGRCVAVYRCVSFWVRPLQFAMQEYALLHMNADWMTLARPFVRISVIHSFIHSSSTFRSTLGHSFISSSTFDSRPLTAFPARSHSFSRFSSKV